MKVDIYVQNSGADIDLYTDTRVCYQSCVKLDGFLSWLGASSMSSQIEEVWYNKIVCLCMIIYMFPILKVDHFRKGINNFLSHNTKVF